MRVRMIGAACSLLVSAANAQTAPKAGASKFDFSIPSIMRGPELYGRAPTAVRWSPDSRWIYFQWAPPGSAWDDPLKSYRINAEGTQGPEPVSATHLDSLAPLMADGPLSTDGQNRLITSGGDLYIVSVRSQTLRRLTQTASFETAPRWGLDGHTVYFQRDGNGWAVNITTGFTKQLTDIRTMTAGADVPPAIATGRGAAGGRGGRGDTGGATGRAGGQRGALIQDQLELLQTIRDQARRDSLNRAERVRDPLPAPTLRSVTLGAGESFTSLDISPTGKLAIITVDRPAGNSRATSVPAYVTADGFTTIIPSRTKVGDEQGARRLGLLDIDAARITWLRTTPADTVRAPSQANSIGWNTSGTRAALFSVSYDFKNRYIHTVGADGKLTQVDLLRDSAWVAGPGFGAAGWLDDNAVWYVSESSGYSHIYTTNADGSGRTALTSGSFEVSDVQVSPDRKWFWFHSTEISPFVQDFYRMPLMGGTRERITTARGGHTVTMAPDGVKYADVFSTSNRPPELFVSAIGSTTFAQRTSSPTAEWLSFNWIKPEIIKIKASDGIEVPARIYEPKSFNAKPNGAAVIFVHGAGYLHNVYDYWSTYSREYMFNQYLASKGYVVLDLDYRGSAGYGRDWRTAIYRWMGGRDLQDHVDASKWLTATRKISPDRIGLYGGSYGGFITLMALFTAGDYFGAGAALRPVTDWAHYNNGYTGRILNLPQDDTTAYRRSSPIFFAQNLKDPLLICHGMVDTNVHYEDSVRLAQRLIELGKTNWELASYPVEDHGFTRPSSWTDEYRRIFELFERNLAKAKP